MTRQFLAAIAIAATLFGAAPAFGQGTNERANPAVLKAFKAVVAEPSESTVRIRNDDRDAALGVVVEADGYIISKASLIARAGVSVVLKNGQVYDAEVVGELKSHDLALLKIEAKGLKPIRCAPGRRAEPGDIVASPGTGDLPVAFGAVSLAVRDLSAKEMRRVSPDPNGGFLGVMLNVTDKGPTLNVSPDSPAFRGGLKTGDVLKAVGGKVVTDMETLFDAMQGYKPNDKVTIEVRRGKAVLKQEVKLGRRPQDAVDRSDTMNRMGSELSLRRDRFSTILHHDTVIRPGDCGGPLVDLDGKAVGINMARVGRTESIAIPSEVVLVSLPELKSGKLAPDPMTPEERIRYIKTALPKAEADIERLRDRSQKAKDANEKRQLDNRIRLLQKRIIDWKEQLPEPEEKDKD